MTTTGMRASVSVRQGSSAAVLIGRTGTEEGKNERRANKGTGEGRVVPLLARTHPAAGEGGLHILAQQVVHEFPVTVPAKEGKGMRTAECQRDCLRQNNGGGAAGAPTAEEGFRCG